VFVLAVMLVPAALPPMESTPIVYTYVSQFQIPRANWAAYSEDTEKSFVPVLEKSLADGTILSWSTFEQVVHTPEGYTHGAAWSSNSIAGLMKVLDEVRKNGPAAWANRSHQARRLVDANEDVPMAAAERKRTCAWSAQWRRPTSRKVTTAMLKKLLVPTFEEQLKKGVATYYGVDEQYVNTSAPSTRCVVITYPQRRKHGPVGDSHQHDNG